MADHVEEIAPPVPAPAVEERDRESILDKISEKLHHNSSSLSPSNSEDEKEKKKEKERKEEKAEAAAAMEEEKKAKAFRIFGWEKPLHKVLDGGKPTDIFLWRDKKISVAVLGGVTAIWVLFELLDYLLLTLVCHSLILTLVIMFLWSNTTTFINKSPPHIPEVGIYEDLAVKIALSLRYYINRGFAALREIASGCDLKKFLVDHVDFFVEKATVEAKKHYGMVHANYISKIPAVAASLKGKKVL